MDDTIPPQAYQQPREVIIQNSPSLRTASQTNLSETCHQAFQTQHSKLNTLITNQTKALGSNLKEFVDIEKENSHQDSQLNFQSPPKYHSQQFPQISTQNQANFEHKTNQPTYTEKSKDYNIASDDQIIHFDIEYKNISPANSLLIDLESQESLTFHHNSETNAQKNLPN